MIENLLITLLLIAVAYFLITRRPKEGERKTSTIFIYGLPNSGKTELFYQLLYDRKVETTSSMEINKGQLKIDDRSYSLVDVPGYPSFFIDLKKSIDKSAAIVFLIDLSKK